MCAVHSQWWCSTCVLRHSTCMTAVRKPVGATSEASQQSVGGERGAMAHAPRWVPRRNNSRHHAPSGFIDGRPAPNTLLSPQSRTPYSRPTETSRQSCGEGWNMRERARTSYNTNLSNFIRDTTFRYGLIYIIVLFWLSFIFYKIFRSINTL